MAERITSLQQQNSFTDNLVLSVDRKLCGDTLLPAEKLERITDDHNLALELAKGRFTVATGAALQVFGSGLSTYGLSEKASTPIPFLVGKSLEISGALIETHQYNKNASTWLQAMEGFLWKLGPYSSAVKTVLADKGISEEEITSLYTLPTNIYVAEISRFNINRAARVGRPVSNAIALGSIGEYAAAGLVGSLGLASFPAGEFFYKQSDKQRRYEFMAGRTSRQKEYLESRYDAHVSMTDKLHFLSKTPEFLFAIKFLTDRGGNLLATFNGLNEGLTGVSGMLSHQRTRESSRRTVEIATHLIDAVTSKPFIATPQRWREHTEKYGNTELEDCSISDGLSVRNFKAVIPSGEETNLQPISFDVSAGGAVVLQAGSGEGKSVTLMGMMHLLENTGTIHLVENGETKDVHSLCGTEELSRKILLITEEGLSGTERISDIFKHSFESSHRELFLSQLDKKTSAMLLEVAWRMTDSLLEAEIEKIAKGEKAVFPKRMLDKLIELRETRNSWVNENLNISGGNLSKERVNATRIFSSLSAGEKRRLLVASAKAEIKSGDAKAVIFDEPLAHLDDENRKIQMEQLRELQCGDKPVALIIVAHEHISDLVSELNYTEHYKIETNGN